MSQFRDNVDDHRFEWAEQGEVAFADYRVDAHGVRAILHVETPPHLRGQGVAKRLMDGAVAYAREADLKIRAICPYAVAYFKRYPEAVDVKA
ncbi:MAG TPA: GNAT family N-acetyltransferase [Caulobacterales bacterium]|nr:GNAT family N-acetyltransferase [Caulobacterales bacterium]